MQNGHRKWKNMSSHVRNSLLTSLVLSVTWNIGLRVFFSTDLARCALSSSAIGLFSRLWKNEIAKTTKRLAQRAHIRKNSSKLAFVCPQMRVHYKSTRIQRFLRSFLNFNSKRQFSAIKLLRSKCHNTTESEPSSLQKANFYRQQKCVEASIHKGWRKRNTFMSCINNSFESDCFHRLSKGIYE